MVLGDAFGILGCAFGIWEDVSGIIFTPLN